MNWVLGSLRKGATDEGDRTPACTIVRPALPKELTGHPTILLRPP